MVPQAATREEDFNDSFGPFLELDRILDGQQRFVIKEGDMGDFIKNRPFKKRRLAAPLLFIQPCHQVIEFLILFFKIRAYLLHVVSRVILQFSLRMMLFVLKHESPAKICRTTELYHRV